MKKLSKIVALLLAGAMAMVMLTACSGGSNAETKAKENKMIDSLKEQGVMTASENDNTLRKKTMEILNQDIADASSAFWAQCLWRMSMWMARKMNT